MYGQTEASPRISYLPFKKAKTKIGSIGKVIPGGKIFLINKNKKSGVGELSYKGNNVFMGYTLGQKDLQKSKRKITILKTGDLAKKDREGYYYVVGRKDRIVKVAGNRIDLEELNKIARTK
jgi:acyl-CoA synthetase (AMP-forming)/AMP-acid ligase II